MTQPAARPAPETLAGVCVPAGTYNPNIEDPRRPSIARQRKHATDLVYRVFQAYGLDFDAWEMGTPLPPGLAEDLRRGVDMYDELIVDYIASLTIDPSEEPMEEEPCHAEPTATAA
ncbi:hypothetical protein ABT352_32845 [Streptosporangium sp. NPDC000563]|uniref:hypothetical protein n=1 Tax=Streptosporangium sp. NPDC000563 TaxID=3154366 RepID=UPI00331F3C7B